VAWLDAGRVRAVGRHEELWRLAEYRAVFAEGADPAGSPAGDGGYQPVPDTRGGTSEEKDVTA
jgi:ATP-binding cassette subfamily B protein